MEMGNKNTEQIVDVGSVVEAVSAEDGDASLYKVERRKWHNNVLDDFDSALPKGCCYRLEVPSDDQKLFHRQVVKSESATTKIPELDFEIPTEAQRRSLSTLEGILVRAADELQAIIKNARKWTRALLKLLISFW
ncbi:hypothetical protein Dsin_007444 [Dipteronia sinensis]|uniref:Zinc finger ZPR1-type domain-containing protein n=1 Tax=Dipteronia sinensis TaxID=43782 RepID=A0AAE0B0J9_9ROSI|nr:hypothetical protein Dsin_007444 [Dipteronia sinensis]